jgi:hypothetical protein
MRPPTGVTSGLLLAALLGVWLAPKISFVPPRLTTNNWDREIIYRSQDGDIAVHCQFYAHDSTPYWEGSNAWEDENVCGKIPLYLHRGLPPQAIQVRIWGRDDLPCPTRSAGAECVELRAPMIWGRLFSRSIPAIRPKASRARRE